MLVALLSVGTTSAGVAYERTKPSVSDPGAQSRTGLPRSGDHVAPGDHGFGRHRNGVGPGHGGSPDSETVPQTGFSL